MHTAYHPFRQSLPSYLPIFLSSPLSVDECRSPHRVLQMFRHLSVQMPRALFRGALLSRFIKVLHSIAYAGVAQAVAMGSVGSDVDNVIERLKDEDADCSAEEPSVPGACASHVAAPFLLLQSGACSALFSAPSRRPVQSAELDPHVTANHVLEPSARMILTRKKIQRSTQKNTASMRRMKSKTDS